MGMTAAEYLNQLQSLFPEGAAWTREPDTVLTSFLAGLADEFSRVDSRGDELLLQIDPRTTLEMLPDWERFAGLPDTCAGGIPTTIEERRAALVAKLLATGGASRAYFMALAAALGYDIEIEVYRPFVCGRSRCGDRLNGGAEVRHIWFVRVPGPRLTYFRTGQSQCGDSLGRISRAVDLECKFQRLKQAHTNLIFSYEGA